MNIRRGLYRVWIVASVLWLAGFSWYFWNYYCFYDGGTVLCWTGEENIFAALSEFSLRQYASVVANALLLPFLTLILGYAFAWVARGFLSTN
jgi:hypothetical protein